MQRKIVLLLLLMLLLVPVGMAAAQSSPNFSQPRMVMVGGGQAGSSSYTVTTVIGQPVTAGAESKSFRLSGGFLLPERQSGPAENKVWLPFIRN